MPVFGVILVRIQCECGEIRTRITLNTDTFHTVTDFGFSIFSCRTWNNFNKSLVVAVLLIQNKSIEYIGNVMSKRQQVFTENIFTIIYLKCSKNRKFTRNLNFKNFKRSSFGEYIHVTFLS